MSEFIDTDEEYNNPDVNFMVLVQSYQNRLKSLVNDKTNCTDPEVKAFAEKRYLELRTEYYKILAKDMEIIKMYENPTHQNE